MSDLIQMRWPDGLKERVDEVAAGNRTAWVVSAVEAALGGQKISTAAAPGNPVSGDKPAVKSDVVATVPKPVKRPQVRPAKRRAASSGDQEAVLKVLEEFPAGRTERQLAQALGWFEGRVAKTVKSMVAAGLVHLGAGGSVEVVG
ncbi:MAG: hypothetical protein JXQ91_07665 [Vannielia sp.]|uniref:hypothetical protein n=1 Tax=Vannielia sp. TaxID=2813045 RepID=UPI003B8B4A5D